MIERLNRCVDGVEERLCWRFAVHGRADPAYEPADGDRGPFNPDRRRRLQRGETFQRLDRSGRPRVYQGLSWRPAGAIAIGEPEKTPPIGETPMPPAAAAPPDAETMVHDAQLREAEHAVDVAEIELADAVRDVPTVARAEKTLASDRVEGALDGVMESRAKLQELQLRSSPEDEP